MIELSRRAGVAGEFLQRWSVAFSPQGDSLVAQPQPGAAVQIRFPLARTGLQMDRVVRKSWYAEPPAEFRDWVPDFIVPFCTQESTAGQPLFTEERPQQFSCTEDILASIVLTLSRFEEIGSRPETITGASLRLQVWHSAIITWTGRSWMNTARHCNKSSGLCCRVAADAAFIARENHPRHRPDRDSIQP